MSSYADRFSAAADRRQDSKTGLKDFQSGYPFELDAFQLRACRALAAGVSVLVAAPTGSGKTLVGEFAAYLARQRGRRLFYTTPIKALSNQKFQELRQAHGELSVGLLTGDNSINPEAPLVVMTTEVLRNMIYADDSNLDVLDFVVMDEVHYLADRIRGAVWEETLIHLPEHVRIIALSATVSNAEEFGAWLQDVRGGIEVIVEEHRPVPLHQHVFHQGRLIDLFRDSGPASKASRRSINPEVVALKRRDRDVERLSRGAHGGSSRRSHVSRASRVEAIEALDRAQLLPAITFIFSRAGCDAAVEQCLTSGVRLTTGAERLEIRGFVEDRCRVLPDEDLAVLGYLHWREALELGFAAHHAGMIPLFKEAVEALFQRGLLKMVFATETLALGINMPARTVVIERLTKWNGEGHVPVGPGEYTQFTGRAGRRGLDTEGHAVVMWHDDLEPGSLANLASARTFPLRSSFQPSYNMAANLIHKYGYSQARLLNEKSFAQFQADHSSKGIVDAIAENEDSASSLAEQMQCHLGDFPGYAQIADELSKLEKSLAAAARTTQSAHIGQALERLAVGDVVTVTRGRRAGAVVVVRAASESPPRVTVLGRDKQIKRVGIGDFSTPPVPFGRLTIKAGFSPRSAHDRKTLASALVHLGSESSIDDRQGPAKSTDERVTELRRRLRAHPCHGCDDRGAHLAAWMQHARLAKERSVLAARRDSRRGMLARQFDRICDVLVALGYFTNDESPQVTEAGLLLMDIYTELDLVTAQALRTGAFDGLQPQAMAAVAAALTYESRRPEHTPAPVISESVSAALLALHRAWAEVTAAEQDQGIRTTRAIDLGLVAAMSKWAAGAPLSTTLQACDLLPGDFVRWGRQTIDLLSHIGHCAAASDDVRATARRAVRAVDRDIVNLTSQSAVVEA